MATVEPIKKPFAGSSEDDERLIPEEMRDRLDQAIAYESVNRELAYEDVRFLHGDQWAEDVKEDRKNKKRPALTFNRLPQFVDQVVGDMRMNSPSIKVRAVSGPQIGAEVKSLDGSNSYDMSQLYNGLIRNIETQSSADEAYETAGQHAVEHGFGYVRVVTEYTDDDIFDQDIRIKRIRNAFSVYTDPMAQEWDKRDMNWAILMEEMANDDFEEQWPNAISSDLGSGTGDWYAAWYGLDTTRVAEYFRRVPTKKVIYLLSDGRVVSDENIEKIADELMAQGIEITAEREVETSKVQWFKCSGAEILEGPIEFPCKYIPVVPVYGRELFIDGYTVYRGLVRHAKDAMRSYNFFRTADVERAALSPKAPWKAPWDTIKNFASIWQTANTDNHSYLPYEPQQHGKEPERIAPPSSSPGETQQSMQANEDLFGTIGIYRPGIGEQTATHKSGRAIRAEQAQGDRGTYSFVDNRARSIEQIGRILIDMIPRIYDSTRVVRIMQSDGSEDYVQINQSVMDEQTGESVTIADMTAGKYDCVVDVGPSYQTQREEAVDSMLDFMKILPPQLAMLVADKLAANMDWPYADEIAKRLNKVLPPGIDEDEPEGGEVGAEGQQPPGQPEIPPEAQMAMQVQEAETEAKMVDAEAKKAKAAASIAASNAKIAETEGMTREQVREWVAESIAEYMTQAQQWRA